MDLVLAWAREEGITHILHIDADEFLWPETDIASALDVAEGPVARVRPVEALGGSTRHFKAMIGSGDAGLATAAELYPTFHAYLKRGFLSHVQGKVFVRTGLPEIEIRIHNAFQHGASLPAPDVDALTLLHCHTGNWEAWHARYAYRLESGSYRAELQPARPRAADGVTLHEVFAALLDNAGNIAGALSAEGAKAIAGLQAQTAGINAVTASASLGLSESIASALDANGDGVISAQEAQTASIVSAYQSTVFALASAIDRNGAMTVDQIRTSLAGKASDAAINAVISAVDRNKDGIVSAEEIAVARTLSGLSSNTAAQLQALTQQSMVFGHAITGQTGSITGTQNLTNDELGRVQGLQADTVTITELVERAVEGNAGLTSSLLSRLSEGMFPVLVR